MANTKSFWITLLSSYYEGDQISPTDVQVPQRPDATYDWNGSAWVQNSTRLADANKRTQAIIDAATVLQSTDVTALLLETPAQITAVINAQSLADVQTRKFLIAIAIMVRQLALTGSL